MEIIDKVFVFFKERIWLAALIFLLFLLLFIYIYRQSKTKKYARIIDDLEVRYNKIKSIPLAFKINKNEALVNLSETITHSFAEYKNEFDFVQDRLKKTSVLLNEGDDYLAVGKNRAAKKVIIEIVKALNELDTCVNSLDKNLDKALVHESDLRVKANTFKEKLINQKQLVIDNSLLSKYCGNVLEEKFSRLEASFSEFEEWMFVTEYQKAGESLAAIESNVVFVEEIINKAPGVIESLDVKIPALIVQVEEKFKLAVLAKANLDHLEIIPNLDVIRENQDEDLKQLKNGNVSEVKQHCEQSINRLDLLLEQIEHEIGSTNDIKKLSENIKEQFEQISTNLEESNRVYNLVSKRFDFTKTAKLLKEYQTSFQELSTEHDIILSEAANLDQPASTLGINLKEFLQKVVSLNNSILESKNELDIVRQDEERAEKQLVKLQLIIREMVVKTRVNKLPSISEDFNGDLNRANQYLNTVSSLLNSENLDIKLLNATLNEAIDYVYKLFNRVNNIVGMAVMVENTIVFGNRYRSIFSDVDSDLTRAELSYQNGEYTHALKTAIKAVERIHPGAYDSLVKEKLVDESYN